RREDLDDERRVEQRVPLLVIEPRLAAQNDEIGIGVEAGLAHFHAQVAVEPSTRAAAKLAAERRGHIERDGAVLRGSASHGEDPAIEVLAPSFRCALEREILLGREIRFYCWAGLNGHWCPSTALPGKRAARAGRHD